MPTAKEIAAELRKVAEVIEHAAEATGAEGVQLEQPTLSFNHWTEKEKFLAAVRVLPHPLTKDYGKDGDLYATVTVTHETDALRVQARCQRSAVCRIVEPARPARFECEPLLSHEEDAALVEEDS